MYLTQLASCGGILGRRIDAVFRAANVESGLALGRWAAVRVLDEQAHVGRQRGLQVGHEGSDLLALAQGHAEGGQAAGQVAGGGPGLCGGQVEALAAR